MERRRAQLMNSPLYGVNNDAVTSEANDGRYGIIPGVKLFDTWKSREDCAKAGVHVATFAGIAGTVDGGAYSVVLSGGYEDDEDNGDTFFYTGTGGRGKHGSFEGGTTQTEDQTFEHHDNATLKKSAETKRPVRVIRGPNPRSKYAPSSGYRYDGLYVVQTAELAKGRSGFQVCKFRLRRVDEQAPIPVTQDKVTSA